MKRLFLLPALFAGYQLFAQPAWQQHVDTKIDVRLDDKGHFLHAFETFEYVNNSPDTLKYIYIHLWPNAYKNDRTPFARQQDINGSTAFYYSKPEDRGYIDSLQFSIDGQGVDYYSQENVPDIARIDLLKPLLPGGRMKVSTPFRVKLPKVFSRSGHTGQAYYVAQWFPKPAVYDQKGWHPISYLDQGEFFSEYGSYDVAVTLPANYVLMATGNCLDEKENAWLDERAKQPLPSDTLYRHGFPQSDAEMKTVHYHEDNIHDFAWFADKRFMVRKDTVYSPGNGQLVTTWAAFLPSYAKVWKKAPGYLKETIAHYGKWVGPYQYKTIKAVLGDMHAGGGMEYPTITLIDKGSYGNLETVVVHEGGHNWFYGMLGSNERDHAWMDEGINSFYEQKTVSELDSNKKRKPGLDETLLYYQMAATGNDQAIEQTSANFTKLNYGLDVYYKTAMVLRWLEAYMGPEDFEHGMKDYYEKWHFHHPYPEDFRACMKAHTTKNIDWFFDTMLTEDKKVDFTITHARADGGNTKVTVRNNSGVLSPVLVNMYQNDSLIAQSWTQPFAQTATINLPGTAWDRLRIDDVIPDGKQANDVYRRRALFHHFGVKVKPFLGLNVADKDKLFLSPAIGYNQYDGFMLGILLHNLTLPENRFRYAVAPMYSFATQSFAGAGSVGYIWYPKHFKDVMLQVDAKTFHDNETLLNLTDPLYASYVKIAPSITFTFKEPDPLSSVTRTLTFKEYNIIEHNITFGDTLGKPVLTNEQKTYGLIQYVHRNDRTYNPFNYMFTAQGGADFVKIGATGNLTIDYYSRLHKALYVRGYIGKFFPISNDLAVTSRYELNMSYSGIDDYLYDGAYRGRNAYDGFSAHQVSIQEGGFKIPVYNNVGRSDNWLAAINLKTDLPYLGKFLPIRLFFDAGMIPNPTPDEKHASSTAVLYEGGAEVFLLKDIVSVYFPFIMSSDYQNYVSNTFGRKHIFERSISFTVDLQNINWLRSPSKLVKSAVN